MSKHLLKFNVNGKDYAIVVQSHERLLDVLRDKLELKGAKEGCSTGDCGICAILMDGKLVNSCLVLAIQARGKKITTIEGIGTAENLHPIQRAFMKWNAAQCGYCIPAMILATKSLLDKNPNPSDNDIKRSMSGILCRCTGYVKLFEAVKTAAAEMKAAR
ncbi:MAG TPA: (2Fe-2S)-binding protein [Terriglobales bacterium]|nr:(2Fe-2S)-binding protein [Terriglobales bacterium]